MKKILIRLLSRLLHFLHPFRTVAVINDCCGDENGKGRIASRISSLFGYPASALVAVNHTIEASLNILDQLKVIGKAPGVIIVNIAPRDTEDGKIFKNGTHFGYLWVGNTLIVSTISGYTLSSIKKFALGETIHVLDLDKSADVLVQEGIVTPEEGRVMKETQFRSCYFQLPAAYFLSIGGSLPHQDLSIKKIPDAPQAVASVDGFGNLKTNVTVSDLGLNNVQKVHTIFGPLPFHRKLCEVPEGDTAVILGSSGFHEPLLEIVTKGRGKNSLKPEIGTRVFGK